MFENIETFKIASGLARHAADRQAVIATNIANADTPGYRAGDLGSFASQFDRWDWASRPLDGQTEGGMRATRPEHLSGAKPMVLWDRVDAPDETSPNGNTVSLEGQMVKSASASSQHDLAMTLYRSSINLMRAAIGKAR
jgi:flagellar basal-body rod protein FlgB